MSCEKNPNNIEIKKDIYKLFMKMMGLLLFGEEMQIHSIPILLTKTTNYVIPQKEIDLKGSIESHTDLPGHPKFPNYLKKIPRLSNPKPIKNEN